MRSTKEHKTIPTPRVNGNYYKKGPNDIGKKSIPKKDRCEGFDDIWDLIYYQVLETWEWKPVTDLRQFGGKVVEE